MPPAIWLGGGSGAGKTTISRTIAARHDLAYYRIDAHAYAHRDRLVASGVIEPDTTDRDQRWLATSPAGLADQFSAGAARIVPLVLDDLRSSSPGVGVVIEGPHLFPSLVAPHLTSQNHGLWLLPTETFQLRALAARPGNTSRFTSDPARALGRQIERNQLLDARTRAEAERFGLTVLHVDGSQDLPAMTERVTAHFADAIAVMPAIRTGSQRQRQRQLENDANVRNVRAFLADLGSAAPAEPPSIGFSCECMTLGCEQLTSRTLTEYDRLRAAGQPLIGHDGVT